MVLNMKINNIKYFGMPSAIPYMPQSADSEILFITK